MHCELPQKIFKKPTDPNEPVFNRREAAQIALGAGIAGATSSLLMKTGIERIVEGREDGFEKSEIFERQITGYKMLYGELERDEILFVDQDGLPIGHPVSLKPLEGVSPGTMDSQRLVVGSLDQGWLNLQRARICAETNTPCDLPNSLPRQMNVITPIREAVAAGLNPDTFVDIVRHYGGQRLANGERKIDFVRKHIMDQSALPEGIKKELARVLPSLAAQESRYNNESRSSVGAAGTFQFMPDTWKELGYTEADLTSFETQVNAAQKYFARIHKFVSANAEDALAIAKKEYFEGDEATFEKFFLVPIMINAYNTGPGRIAVVVKKFLELYPTKKALEALIGNHPDGLGLDAYIAMAREMSGHDDGQRKVPGYGKDSSEYVPRIYALADLID